MDNHTILVHMLRLSGLEMVKLVRVAVDPSEPVYFRYVRLRVWYNGQRADAAAQGATYDEALLKALKRLFRLLRDLENETPGARGHMGTDMSARHAEQCLAVLRASRRRPARC